MSRATTAELGTGARAFLTLRQTATFTTLRPDGTPHVAPVRFTFDIATGLARVTTRTGARKARNITAGGPVARVALCQADGFRRTTIEGRATVTDDPDRIAEAVRRRTAREAYLRRYAEQAGFVPEVRGTTGHYFFARSLVAAGQVATLIGGLERRAVAPGKKGDRRTSPRPPRRVLQGGGMSTVRAMTQADAMTVGEDARQRRLYFDRSNEVMTNLVAVDRGGRVVGWACVGAFRGAGSSTTTAELYALYAAPSLIGCGIGRTLLEAVHAHARARRFDLMLLWVLDAGIRARRF